MWTGACQNSLCRRVLCSAVIKWHGKYVERSAVCEAQTIAVELVALVFLVDQAMFITNTVQVMNDTVNTAVSVC